jgi:hypothetical protein
VGLSLMGVCHGGKLVRSAQLLQPAPDCARRARIACRLSAKWTWQTTTTF